MRYKSVLFLSIILVVNSTTMLSSAENNDFPYSSNDDIITNALDFLKNQQKNDGNIGGIAVSAWASMAISAAGENLDDWGNFISYLENKTSLLDEDKPEDWQRHTLAVVACKQNPKDFAGIDLVEKIIDFYDGNQIGSTTNLFDDCFGILALISAGVDKNESIIQSTKSFIIDNQNPDGGWGDSDSTAAAVMALIAAGENKNSFVISDALYFLKTLQSSDGGFNSWGNANIASTAWVVMAINSVDDDPSSINWQKNGNTPIDYFISLQQKDGSFNWTDSKKTNSEWMTSYVIPALLGKTYPVKISEESYILDDNSDDDKSLEEPSSENDGEDKDKKKEKIESERTTTYPDEDDTIIFPSEKTYYLLNQKILCHDKLKPQKPVVFGLLDIKVETDEDVVEVEFYLNGDFVFVDSKKPFSYRLNNISLFKRTEILVKSYIYKNITVEYKLFLEKIQDILNIIGKKDFFDSIKDFFKPGTVNILTVKDTDSTNIIYTNLFPTKYSKIF